MRGFVTTGAAPQVRGISAVALYDTSGTIHHMHYVITHVGSRDVDPETMIRDAISHATAAGRDVARLKARHFVTVPNVNGSHRVDIATQMLVEAPPRSIA
jgi:hypothetical protein